MKLKIALSAAVFAAGLFSASAVTLTVDQVKQRYPWNGLVDIDYTIVTNGTETIDANDALEVTMVDNGVVPAVTNRAIRFLQTPLPMTMGSHRITWDAHADGVTTLSDKAAFIVEIAHYAEAYMVIDVSGGSTATTSYGNKSQ